MKPRRTFHRSVLGAAVLVALSPAAFATDYTFSGGVYTTPNPIDVGDIVNLVAGAQKFINSAVINNGTINASDDLYFQNGNVLTNTGLFDWSTDSGFYDGGSNGGFANTGILRKSGGTGTSFVSINGFSNSGTIDAQTGTINFIQGATFNAGSQFTGAGSVLVSSSATFNGAFTSQNLTLAAGNFSGNAAQINGVVTLSGGALTGAWEVASGQALALTGGGQKFINGAVTNNGTMTAKDDLFFQNGNAIANHGVYDLQGDYGFFDGGSNGGFVNAGTLRKSAGTGTSFVSINGFSNSGTIDVQTGTLNFNAGATFDNGSKFTGAGQTVITNGATFNGTFTTGGNLTLAAGGFSGNSAKIDGNTNWTGGTLLGAWEVAASRSLTIAAGNQKFVNGSVTNSGSIVATDDLYFQNGNVLVNNGTYAAKGDYGLYDGGSNGGFTNNGTYAKTAGAGTTFVSINNFSNNGTIDAESGVINFNTGVVFNAGSQFTGAGQVVVTGGATFNGAFTTAGNLTLVSGGFNGNAAKIAGDTTFSGGSLTGTWEVASGSRLGIVGGNQKFLNGALTNSGSIVATDDLYLQNGNVLTNNGTYAAKGDYGLFDGGSNGSFVNNGTFSKTAGLGTSAVSINGFVNNGTVDAQAGTILFNTGAVFNDGSKFTGAGQVVVNNGANFSGNISTANNLTLAGGGLNGGNGTIAQATLASGNVTWTGGSLTGAWQVGSGQTLNVAGGAQKFVNGSVTNSGSIAATDDIYLQNGNTLTNNGVYEAKGDVGVGDGGSSGHFVNNGTFLKSGGGGVTSVAAIDFTNPGTMDVRSGTIALRGSFANAGTMTGTGAFSTDVLTNNGHVAPGTGAGTLTLNASYVQTALGSLDTQLASSTLFDTLLVNGTATLDGTLALSCIGACALHDGDSFVILDATSTLTGTFANVTTQGFGSGFQYSVVYDNSADLVKLEVINAGVMPVPEPGTWALMAGGLGAMTWVARRRRAALDARG